MWRCGGRGRSVSVGSLSLRPDRPARSFRSIGGMSRTSQCDMPVRAGYVGCLKARQCTLERAFGLVWRRGATPPRVGGRRRVCVTRRFALVCHPAVATSSSSRRSAGIALSAGRPLSAAWQDFDGFLWISRIGDMLGCHLVIPMTCPVAFASWWHDHASARLPGSIRELLAKLLARCLVVSGEPRGAPPGGQSPCVIGNINLLSVSECEGQEPNLVHDLGWEQ